MSAVLSMTQFGARDAPTNAVTSPTARETIYSAQDLRTAVRRDRSGSIRVGLSALDRVLRFDPARSLVEVQAHATWRTLAVFLAERMDRSREILRHLRSESIIGTDLSLNAPGPDGCPMIRHIVALSIVTADGELKRASREINEDLFRHVIGGQGLFGLPYSFTISLDSLLHACRYARAPVVLDLSSDAQLAGSALQLLVPPDALHRTLDGIVGITNDWRVPILRAEVREIQPETESALPWAKRHFALIGLSLGMPEKLGGRVRKEQLDRELIDLAISKSGAYPIACTPQASAHHLRCCYPDLPRFLAHKRRLDPAGRFDTPWFQHHQRLLQS